MVALAAPLFLLLLIPLAALIVVAGRQPGRASRGGLHPPVVSRRGAALGLRSAGLALLIVALAQPTWAAGRAAPVLFVVDRSASITPAMRADEEAWLRTALPSLPPGTARGVVTFAGGARLALLQAAGDRRLAIEGSLSPIAYRLPPATEGQTDIAGALRLALSA